MYKDFPYGTERSFAFMDMLKKFFPLSFQPFKKVADLVINILIQVLIGVLVGILIGILVHVPVIGLIVGIVGTVLDLYITAGIVFSILHYTNVLK